MSRDRALRLYRHILRLHRHVLPADMRGMGDAYVKSVLRSSRQASNRRVARRAEFHRHKAADSKFIGTFFQQWEDYASQLALQASVGSGKEFGTHLAETDLDAMTSEQLAQLEELRRAARR
jgi:predicted phage gp36 major capsid-like protein